MPAVTRISDRTSGSCNIGEDCCSHSRSGTNDTGSSDVFMNGNALHRQNDTGPCNCPHGGSYSSVNGSESVFCNGLPVTRVGDPTSCMLCSQPGIHITGSPNVFSGGEDYEF